MNYRELENYLLENKIVNQIHDKRAYTIDPPQNQGGLFVLQKMEQRAFNFYSNTKHYCMTLTEGNNTFPDEFNYTAGKQRNDRKLQAVYNSRSCI